MCVCVFPFVHSLVPTDLGEAMIHADNLCPYLYFRSPLDKKLVFITRLAFHIDPASLGGLDIVVIVVDAWRLLV